MTRVYWLEARTEFLKFARMKSYSISVIFFASSGEFVGDCRTQRGG